MNLDNSYAVMTEDKQAFVSIDVRHLCFKPLPSKTCLIKDPADLKGFYEALHSEIRLFESHSAAIRRKLQTAQNRLDSLVIDVNPDHEFDDCRTYIKVYTKYLRKYEVRLAKLNSVKLVVVKISLTIV